MTQCETKKPFNDFIIIEPQSPNKDKPPGLSAIEIGNFSDSESLDSESSEDAENFKEQEMCNYCFCQ